MKKPRVAVILGSKSDLPALPGGEELLARFGIDYKVIVASAGPKVPTKMADGAQSGPMLPTMVELRTSITPSVRKMAPPYQPKDWLPLIVLFSMVASPSIRIPPPVFPAWLPLIVLRAM